MKHYSDLQERVEEIEALLGYSFKEKTLVCEAFVHRSFLNESDGDLTCNERLEFLGDSVLGLLISHHLFAGEKEAPEGELSWIRSKLIEASACARYVTELGLERFLLMGKGERMNKGRGRDSLHADLLEAVLGALYLDGGLDAARAFVEGKLTPFMKERLSGPVKNYKALVQTYVQRNFRAIPLYTVVEERGPEHEREFCVEVIIDDKPMGRAWGRSKREAERAVAELAWKKIEEIDGGSD